MSRDALEAYLSRSFYIISLSGWQPWCCNDPHAVMYQKQLEMIRSVGAKLIGRASNLFWSRTATYDATVELQRAERTAKDVHAIDPDIILQASILEAVGPRVNTVAIPSWVFDEFGVPRETRNFKYEEMLFEDASVDRLTAQFQPDITRVETQMWYYFWARNYIDAGYENLHLGVLESIDKNDRPDHRHLFALASRIRRYGALAGRRNIVLLDAYGYPHVDGRPGPLVNGVKQGVYGFIDSDGKTLLDYNSANLRPKENSASPQDCVLGRYQDTIFGRSSGGVTPSGWECDQLPYAVELDVGGAINPGTPIGWPTAWGWDEASWFAHQTESYRNDWLRYAYHWLRSNDANGFLRMPGSCWLGEPEPHPNWYHACAPWYTGSGSVAREVVGFNQLPVIQSLWSGSDDPLVLNGDFSRPSLGGDRVEFVAPDVPSWEFRRKAGVAVSGSLFAGDLQKIGDRQVGFIQGDGELIQALSFPGGAGYALQLTLSQRVVNSVADAQIVRVFLDDVLIWEHAPTPEPQRYEVPLGAPTPGIHMLRIAGNSATTRDTALLTAVLLSRATPSIPAEQA